MLRGKQLVVIACMIVAPDRFVSPLTLICDNLGVSIFIRRDFR